MRIMLLLDFSLLNVIRYNNEVKFLRTSADEIPPSSPELEDDKDPLSSHNFLLTRALSYKDPPDYQAPSPTIPFQILPNKGK